MKQRDEASDEVGLTPIMTAVVWIGCVVVGLTGILTPIIRLKPPAKQLSPVQVTLMRVELTQTAAPQPNAPPPAAKQPTEQTAPAPPPAAAIAQPSPSIAFQLPTSLPAAVATAADAVPARQPSASDTAAPTVQHITYGVGEGQQPKPEYPLEAQIAREYGAITIRFTIDQDGNVTDAQVIKRCPYPDLNQSALRGVRDLWHFAPGPPRIAETEIDYAPKSNEGSP